MKFRHSSEQVEGRHYAGWLLDLGHDARYALRIFGKNPGTTAVAVLSLALAIGPNATLFSVVDRMFLRPVTVQGSSRMYFLSINGDRQNASDPFYPDFLDYQSRGREVADFTASVGQAVTVSVNGTNELVSMEMVSENYFRVLGVRAAVGRTLAESDARFQGAPPVMLSYSLWQRKFGGATDVVGKTIMLWSRPAYVVGVAPRGFREPRLLPNDVWGPLTAGSAWDKNYRADMMQRGKRTVNVTVRLRDGVNRQQAEAALSVITAQLTREYPATNKGTIVNLRPVDDRGMAVIGAMMLSLVSLVLLIACANLAGIRLAQGEARRREFAMRLALGAVRGRLLRQLLTESALLALAAAALGLLFARTLIQALPAALPPFPFTMDFGLHVDAGVLTYSLALAMIATLAAGLLPALRVSRPDLTPALKGGAPGGKSRSWFRGSLIVAQIACSQFLLVGTGLLLGSYFQVQHIRPGFDISRYVLLATVLPNGERPNIKYDYQGMLARLQAIPGVRRVSSVADPPLSGSGGGTQQVSIPGVLTEPVGIAGSTVGPEYFTAMGTAILRGRDFTKSDSDGTAIVNERMARRFWGDAGRAIGQLFRVNGEDRQIVGVVETGKYQSLLEQPMPDFFLFTFVQPILLIETAGDPAAMAGAVRKTFQEQSPGFTLFTLVTLRQQMAFAFFIWQAGASLLGILAVLGIFLSGIGLYGVVSYGVTRRTHEIGARMAMGARPSDVLRLVLRQGLSMVAIGAAIGTAVAVAAARVLSAILYRVSPADPLTLTEAVLAVAVVTFLAIQTPARRAIRTDPMSVLRSE
jgi:putative ABC transport system permease protein